MSLLVKSEYTTYYLFMIKKIIFLCFISLVLFSCSRPGDLTIQRAMKAYQNQNFDEALILFNEALNEDTNYHKESIYNFISTIYAVQEDLENSVVYAEKALELRPDYRGYVTLGRNYHLIGNDEKAEFFYKKAIEMNAQKGEAYASFGSLLIGQKKYNEAAAVLEKAAMLEPKIAVIHANLAIAYHFAGDGEKSEMEFKKAEEFKCENIEEFRKRINEE